MSGTGHNSFQAEPLTGAIGAEISGIDLADKLSDESIAALRGALNEHLVLFFRDQVMSPAQHVALARRFGDLHTHPIIEAFPGHPELIEVIKEAEEVENWGDLWHTDLPAQAEPPLGSILYAKEVPPFTGDTQWANMYLAHDTLSPSVRAFIAPLKCDHWQEVSSYTSRTRGMKERPNPQESHATHPLVRTHPETGKKSLYLPKLGRGRIRDMSNAESDAILRMLHQHADNPDFACRFRWRKNSVAFWDNRCTRHRVTADYFYKERGLTPHRRHMHRVAIAGDRPV